MIPLTIWFALKNVTSSYRLAAQLREHKQTETLTLVALVGFFLCSTNRHSNRPRARITPPMPRTRKPNVTKRMMMKMTSNKSFTFEHLNANTILPQWWKINSLKNGHRLVEKFLMSKSTICFKRQLLYQHTSLPFYRVSVYYNQLL